MTVKLPGFVYTALILALVTFLQAISTGLDSLRGEWWQPVAVAAVAAALKAAEVWRAEPPAATGLRDFKAPRSKWARFLVG